MGSRHSSDDDLEGSWDQEHFEAHLNPKQGKSSNYQQLNRCTRNYDDNVSVAEID